MGGISSAGLESAGGIWLCQAQLLIRLRSDDMSRAVVYHDIIYLVRSQKNIFSQKYIESLLTVIICRRVIAGGGRIPWLLIHR